ncbi:MAG: type I 3-dehydroquinate dehydratase [Patescibacteria group bacterium]|jgi:3-dehydroquinate dehydratase type I
MNLRICAVVTGKNLKEFLANLKKAQKQTDWVELRADYIKNFNVHDIAKIKAAVSKHAIFTCRKPGEGGNFRSSEKERLAILNAALKSGFDFVDIELSAISKVKIPAAPISSKIICSFHDFNKTSSLSQLKKIAEKMEKTKAQVIKIVTMVKTESDNQKLFELLAGKKSGMEMIVLGMGEKGKITRLLSPLRGGYLTFASASVATAPGQISVKELKSIYKKMGLK